MTPQKQTVFGEGKGNCWATCIAALLDLPQAEIPNFCGEPFRNENWYEDTDAWLLKLGYRLVGLTFPEANADLPIEKQVGIAIQQGTYLIVTGKSPRGEFCHSVVVEYLGENEWEIVCDPHPSGDGLDGPWKACDMIVAASRPRAAVQV